MAAPRAAVAAAAAAAATRGATRVPAWWVPTRASWMHTRATPGQHTHPPPAGPPPALQPMLTRDFIKHSLYDAMHGYFTSGTVIGGSGQPLAFTDMLGRLEYLATLDKLYAAARTGWLTPCEVFTPWYSQALAKYMVRTLMADRAAAAGGGGKAAPLVVYEVGGGNGTNAAAILQYLKESAPALYRDASYTIMEISPGLQRRQAAALAGHACARSVNVDATGMQPGSDGGLAGDDRPCFVIALEVADNLPHDKLVWLEPGGAAHETWVVETTAPGAARRSFAEEYRPIADAWVQRLVADGGPDVARCPPPAGGVGRSTVAAAYAAARALATRLTGTTPDQAAASAGAYGHGTPPPGVAGARFIPTGLLQMVAALHAALPRHRLIAADFDSLPPPTLRAAAYVAHGVSGVGTHTPASPDAGYAPLVAAKSGGKSIDYPNYLAAPLGSSDIFFPTDFPLACRLLDTARSRRAAGAGAARSVSHRDFVAQYAALERTRTLSGYNPLLEDYRNTRMLLT